MSGAIMSSELGTDQTARQMNEIGRVELLLDRSVAEDRDPTPEI